VNPHPVTGPEGGEIIPQVGPFDHVGRIHHPRSFLTVHGRPRGGSKP
jgi:hypothetical protein